MPPKNKDSKISKKELMARKRAAMSDQERAEQRQKDRERKAKKRQELSEHEKEEQRKADCKRMADKRAKDKAAKAHDEIIRREMEGDRKSRAKIRAKQSQAEHEYEKIYNLLCMRKIRSERTEEQHQHDKLVAKNGMKLLTERGFVKEFQNRPFREINEIDIWFKFAKRGSDFMDILIKKRPEIAAQVEEINDLIRKEATEWLENEQRKRDKGYWNWYEGDQRYYWTGKNPPGPEDPDPNDPFPMTDAEWDECHQQWLREANESRKAERNRREREKYTEKKNKLSEPMVLPEFEMSEYEKIREQNIKEREEALRAAGFEIKSD